MQHVGTKRSLKRNLRGKTVGIYFFTHFPAFTHIFFFDKPLPVFLHIYFFFKMSERYNLRRRNKDGTVSPPERKSRRRRSNSAGHRPCEECQEVNNSGPCSSQLVPPWKDEKRRRVDDFIAEKKKAGSKVDILKTILSYMIFFCLMTFMYYERHEILKECRTHFYSISK